MELNYLSTEQRQIMTMIRDFVKREVEPAASALERKDEYPVALVKQMQELGLFGATVSEQYGGMGLNYQTYSLVVEELCKGWMSLAGVINTHLVMAGMVEKYGTEEQRGRYLPAMASGEKRGGIGLTEPNAGSDLAAVETYAVRDGNDYIVNGTKLMITNGERGNAFAVLVKTDRNIKPSYRGLSVFILEKGPGFTAGRHLDKLGYRGVDTSELIFNNFRTPASSLIGLEEGQGFKHVMNGLEGGRINVAARAVGVAAAAFEKAIEYAQKRRSMGSVIAEHQAIQLKLAEMYTKVEAARLLVREAAQKRDRGERSDLEAGMAKLYASEICQEVALDSMRIHGGYGYIKDYVVERFYRDAPLMIIGEGTNEIQKLVIARNLLAKYKI